jgi:hypothetical protein
MPPFSLLPSIFRVFPPCVLETFPITGPTECAVADLIHQTVLINGFGVLFVILNSFGLGVRLSIGKLLAEAFTHWKIAVWALVISPG